MGFAWLYVFAVIGSVHRYEWWLNDPASEISSWCGLPFYSTDIRGGMYLLFLFQFTVMFLVFFRRKRWFFNVLMFLLFCWAAYRFMVRDMLCVSFLQ